MKQNDTCQFIDSHDFFLSLIPQKVYKEDGGELKDGEQVVNIIHGKECTVITNKGEYKGKSVIITAGKYNLIFWIAFTKDDFQKMQLPGVVYIKCTNFSEQKFSPGYKIAKFFKKTSANYTKKDFLRAYSFSNEAWENISRA